LEQARLVERTSSVRLGCVKAQGTSLRLPEEAGGEDLCRGDENSCADIALRATPTLGSFQWLANHTPGREQETTDEIGGELVAEGDAASAEAVGDANARGRSDWR